MKKGTKIGVGVAGATLLAVAGIAPFAYAQSDELKASFDEFRTSIRASVEDGDYETWSTLMADNANEKCEMAQEQITPETFEGVQQMHELKEAGDYEGAKELAEELGLPGMKGKGMHDGKGEGRGMMKGNGEMQEILESRDYATWEAFMNEHEGPMKGQLEVNEDTFNQMLEVHDLMEAGDMEGAKELRGQFRQQ